MAAKGINDIANNRGYLYMTETDGTKILQYTPNTVTGARAMRELGAINAPIAAQRSAWATITCTTTVSPSNCTAVTINGVNQIGGNVALSNDEPTSAVSIAAAINAYTPGSGYDYTAQVVDNVIYVYAPPSAGTAPNGLTITVSSSSGSNVFATTAFSGGSNATGTYDNVIGKRFWIDANYNGTASPTVLTYAYEITDYMTVRGMEAGIITQTNTISSDRLLNLNRACAFTQVSADTQASAATDLIAYIDPTGFIEGDTIILRNLVSSRVPTVQDRTNTSSPTSSPNIILTGAQAFALTGNLSIVLRYKYDSTLGPVWVEQGRSVASGGATLSRAEMMALMVANGVSPGQAYYITDVYGGTIVWGATTSTISTTAIVNYPVPDYQNTLTGFAGVWNASMALPSIGAKYAYNGSTYSSVTGAVGTAPSGDAVNWALVSPALYEPLLCEYNIADNMLLSAEDQRGNKVSASKTYITGSGNNPVTAFQWGNDKCVGNIVSDSNFKVVNYTGVSYGNTITGQSSVNLDACVDTALSPSFSTNLMNTTSYYSNYFVIVEKNNCNGSSVYTNGSAANPIGYFQANNVLDMPVYGNTTSSATPGQGIVDCVLGPNSSGSLSNNVIVMDSGGIYNLRLEGYETSFTNNTIDLGATIYALTLNGRLTVTGCTFNTDIHAVSITSNLSTVQTITTETNPFVSGDTMNSLGSTVTKTLDCDDASIFSGGTLTIPAKYWYVGNFTLTSAAFVTITKIANTPTPFKVRFLVANAKTEKYTSTAVAGAVANNLVAAAAPGTVVLTGRTNGSDEFTVVKDGTFNKIVSSIVLQ